MIITNDWFEVSTSIPDNSIDLAIVDPPYGIGYKDWDVIDFEKFTDKWVSEVFRVLKDTGTLWAFMGYQNIFKFVPILNRYGNVHLENWVIWARQKGRGSSKHLKSQREDIFHVTKSKNYTWNNLKLLREVAVPYMKEGKPRGWFLNEEGKRVRWTGLGNVWVYTTPFWKSKDDLQIHSAQKPYLLIERLVLLSSNEGDVVLDPFAGSLVTERVCSKNKRESICVEKDLDMVRKATHANTNYSE